MCVVYWMCVINCVYCTVYMTVLYVCVATASVDGETDSLIQKMVRTELQGCTVLTIAHRLHTVMDSSEIMLFEAGSLAEHAPPHLLLDDPVSLFSKLVDDTGSAADHLRKLAREAHEARTAGAV